MRGFSKLNYYYNALARGAPYMKLLAKNSGAGHAPSGTPEFRGHGPLLYFISDHKKRNNTAYQYTENQ